jgi:hypothetical protein
MKYIVMQVSARTDKNPSSWITMQIPFLFANIVVHSDMREHVKALLSVQYKGAQITCISAGFINGGDIEPRCHGESISLNIKSRGREDDLLIAMLDYGSMHL